ncbi:DUF2147 domain-containing protein [Sphingomonas oligophenolica]|nr:DUF2147 domain-containing protein [Sphingomonas oligophenolica]
MTGTIDTMRGWGIGIAMLVAGTVAGSSIAAKTGAANIAADPVFGTWRNPKGTLTVETAPCRNGGALCGAIVWASDKARADARAAGVATLIGTQLLSDYHRTGQGNWSGTVYIPDMGRSFSSRIKQVSPETLTISGCLIHGFICKSQVWHRIA